MNRYLLDTNILSDIVRNPTGPAARRIGFASGDAETHLCTSIIVAAELRYGVAKKASALLANRVDQLLATIEVAVLASGGDKHYGVLRAELERKGQSIGPNDMLIAAHALALDAVLVTDNLREFKRVKGLRVENWLRP